MDIDHTLDRLLRLIPNLRVIVAHGKHDDLLDRILAFTSGKADVLLSTTVIENGIDMPRVNTIVVLSSHRFGMSALYQLRGRVGRSSIQAYAHFFTNSTRYRVGYMISSKFDLDYVDIAERPFHVSILVLP